MELTDQFLKELLKASVTNKTFLEILSSNLKDNYIPDELYKKIFKNLIQYHQIHNKTPTIGVLQQEVGDVEANPIFASLGDIYTGDKEEQLLLGLQDYLKKARLLELSAEVADLYNKGDHDKAIAYMSEQSKQIDEFTLLGYNFGTVFGDFVGRAMDRIDKDRGFQFVPTNLPAFDHFSGGGLELGRSFLAIARSGVGKSYLLRQLCFNAAMWGYAAIHFQAEGTEDEVYEYYDAMWANMPVKKMKYSDFTEAEHQDIDKRRGQYLKGTGEVYVVAFEQFDKASIADCRRKIIELKKVIAKRGQKLGLVAFDYLEKFMPGDRVKYGATDDSQRIRKQAVAEKITNIATEFKVVSATATQANNIPKEMWNDQNFYINRENISNLKATIDAFSYCITLNQTEDEDDDGEMRIHEEKQRNYKTKSHQRNYKIVMGRETGWFIDIPKTKERYWDDNKKLIVK